MYREKIEIAKESKTDLNFLNDTSMDISVIGLGKLGLCTAACLAASGHRVFGFDIDPHLTEALKNGICPIKEPGLVELLQKAGPGLQVVDTIAEAVDRTEMTMIVVPTPSRTDGAFSNDYIEAALSSIAPVLANKPDFHVVDVVATVMPGSCDERFIPLLEQATGKKCGRDFGLVYNPEFIALGSVIADFLNPDIVLIGASDQRSGSHLAKCYLTTCTNNPKIHQMSLLNAEIAKLGLNCYITMKISFANQLAELCERLPGADIDPISVAIGDDRRVGGRYLKGGLGFGGPCFPRDNLAFQHFAGQVGNDAPLSRQVITINNRVVDRLVKIVRDNCPEHDRIALIGMAYKQGTHIIEESQAIAFAKRLIDDGYEISVYDPLANREVRKVLGDKPLYCDRFEDSLQRSNNIVLLADLPEIQAFDWESYDREVEPGTLLLDAWRTLKKHRFVNINYCALGLG